jgi:hypothetical protein
MRRGNLRAGATANSVPPAWRYDTEKLPADAPFMGRGILFSGVIQYIKDKSPGGADAVRERLGRNGADIDRMYLAASEYPILPLFRIATAAAAVNRRDIFPYLRERAMAAADADMRGVYKLLLKIASPESTAGQLWKAFNRYFAPCRAEAREVGPGKMDGTLTAIPSCLDGFYVASTEGFVHRAVELAGAKGITFTWSQPTPDTPRAGIATSRIDFDVRWT